VNLCLLLSFSHQPFKLYFFICSFIFFILIHFSKFILFLIESFFNFF
jgi:hypothetical protein